MARGTTSLCGIQILDRLRIISDRTRTSPELLIEREASRSVSPLLMINEYAAFSPTPPPFPNWEQNPSLSEVEPLLLNSTTAHIHHAPHQLDLREKNLTSAATAKRLENAMKSPNNNGRNFVLHERNKRICM
ncbi:hypothetical protein Tcan_01847 [Toxocara canis]|uniref:Uncharacterized protein n=1 Tax=Toxocara canis TaxID=6265 RepID=A0A0B2VAB8_TOXCA|nr:hypothetical protein Tcan_01847 [Toxocara canis]